MCVADYSILHFVVLSYRYQAATLVLSHPLMVAVVRSRDLPMKEPDRLTKENQTLGARLSRLSHASHRITGSLHLATVLQKVVDDARSLTGTPGMMLEPSASAGSQAAQPHLEDGTTYRPLRPTRLDSNRS